ncbi:hypothetical protein NLM25_33710 [Bradyrhizobium sp. CCGB01]|nr:hypothetical protein [Bradyrhizobium sp. CCGB20]MCP3410516.1 hypothetical protein [Bradyrhizobium sp. CCGB01]
MLAVDIARIQAHRNNIRRYQRLLETKLTEVERSFIERRLDEERASVETIAAGAFPVPIAPSPLMAGAAGATP